MYYKIQIARVMKKQNSKINWWIDAILFTGFLGAFLLDVTGLPLHQWGGVFICVLAVYHLLRHWKWVVNIFKRFYTKGIGQQRLRFALDLILLFGFECILLTGLLISSWFDLPLENYLLVRNVHVISSVTTLLALLIKIALHVRWIAATARKIFRRQKPAAALPALPAVNAQQMARRDMLRLMGTVGTASLAAILIGGHNTLSSLTQAKSTIIKEEATSIETPIPTNTPTPQADMETALAEPQVHIQRRNRGGRGEEETSFSTPTPSVDPIHTEIDPQAAQLIPTATPGNCVVRCPKGCAYPGLCRRYTDENGNNLCDLGECL